MHIIEIASDESFGDILFTGEVGGTSINIRVYKEYNLLLEVTPPISVASEQPV